MLNEVKPPLENISVLAKSIFTYESPFQDQVFRHNDNFDLAKSERAKRNVDRERKALLISKLIG
jgi:hypothetical protein